jgi:hypothetical protein
MHQSTLLAGWLALAAIFAFAPTNLAEEDEAASGDQSDTVTRVADTDIELPLGAFHAVLKREYRRELGISDGQAAKIAEVQAEFNAVMRAYFDEGREGKRRDVEAWRAKMEEARREHDSRLTAILSSDQRQRLFEIHLQSRGFRILTEPYVARRLELTAEQQDKVQQCCRLFQGRGERSVEMARADRAAARKEMEQARYEFEMKLGEVLTARQRALFKDLQGEPFEFPTGERR